MTAAAQRAPTITEVERHLRATCRGVFTVSALGRHLAEHVGMGPPRELLRHARTRAPQAATVLDVGRGYGSFVLAAREAALQAVGVEPADPRFLDESIADCTSLGVGRILRRLPVRLADPRLEKLRNPETIVDPRARSGASLPVRVGLSRLLGLAVAASAWNPLTKTIELQAAKEGAA